MQIYVYAALCYPSWTKQFSEYNGNCIGEKPENARFLRCCLWSSVTRPLLVSASIQVCGLKTKKKGWYYIHYTVCDYIDCPPHCGVCGEFIIFQFLLSRLSIRSNNKCLNSLPSLSKPLCIIGEPLFYSLPTTLRVWSKMWNVKTKKQVHSSFSFYLFPHIYLLLLLFQYLLFS